jgi:protein-disulfide isomerase
LIQETDGKILTLPVSRRDHMQGAWSAVVTLVEYGDYACSRSGQAYTVVKQSRQRLGVELRFVFRHFPISRLHPQAQHAAEAAEAAGAQNKFWEMHDILFEHQHALENGFLVEYADKLGLDTTKFLRDMAQHAYVERVCEDFQSGLHSGVNSTPTFFLNGVRHEVLWDVETLLAAVEEAAASQEDGAAPPQ